MHRRSKPAPRIAPPHALIAGDRSQTGKDDREPRPSARYIGELTKELASLARADGCDALSFLLELAAIEAELVGGLPAGQRAS